MMQCEEDGLQIQTSLNWVTLRYKGFPFQVCKMTEFLSELKAAVCFMEPLESFAVLTGSGKVCVTVCTGRGEKKAREGFSFFCLS